jgi:hypothetical protein
VTVRSNFTIPSLHHVLSRDQKTTRRADHVSLMLQIIFTWTTSETWTYSKNNIKVDLKRTVLDTCKVHTAINLVIPYKVHNLLTTYEL